MYSDNVSLMTIPCGFKIRNKNDVETFINECMNRNQSYYLIIQNDFAIFLEKDKDGEVSVLEKRWDLSDPFNPLLEVANTNNTAYKHTVNYYIWKYRKYINAKWFND